MQNKVETKICQNCKNQFTVEPDDFTFYEKIKVPPPTWCPECRLQRRLSWRNARAFYRRNCGKCGVSMISVYAPDSGMTVYCRPCWWSDSWDGMAYGVDFNPKESFLWQLHNLLKRTPLPNLFGLYTTLQNSEYTNMVGYLKDCYFLTMADWNENCSYGDSVYHSKDSFDILMLDKSELCYETINCRECYQVFFSIDCVGCRNVWFSKNLIGCSNCIGCVNLRNKQYYIFNTAYTKEEYERLAPQYQPSSFQEITKLRERVRQLWLAHPQKFIHERLTTNVTGDYLYNCKNVRDSFLVQDMENSRFCMLVLPGKTADCYDHTHYGISSELMYETLQCGNQASRVIGSWFALMNVADVEYSIFAIGSKNVFGTVSLKKREYCILNKQYTRGEYEALRKKIIEQMNAMPYRDARGNEYRYGEFFPTELSPFGYNASTAQELFPLAESEAKKSGYQWKNQEPGAYNITIPFDKIPDTTEKIPSSILEDVITCGHRATCHEQCSNAFKITAAELQFYKRMKLPLPHLCPNCRHYQRLKLRNPLKLWHRTCHCGGSKSQALNAKFQYGNTVSHFHGSERCPNEFETSYAPERPEIVYCESCYNSEVV